MSDWTIVAIDDDPSTHVVLEKRLAAGGQVRVLTAKNAEEGLSLIEKEKPNVVILDHLPPDKAGIQLCKTLKSNPSFQNIPVIFFTSFREFGFEDSAEKAGAMRVIGKLNMSGLLKVLQDLRESPEKPKTGEKAAAV